MPWSKINYPASMKNLEEDTREKAIEIANALLVEKNMEEGIAIAIAIKRAREWAAHRAKQTGKPASNFPKKPVKKKNAGDWYLIPHNDPKWS